MESVVSKDGTRIVFYKSGHGPALVLVHGTSADHTRWAPVLPAFEEQFTVYAVDRRGRGDSGDTEPYDIQREFEDIAAVIDSIGGPVNVLGHSYGALCSLNAALLTNNINKLILDEPPIVTGDDRFFPPSLIGEMEGLLAKGDRDGAVVTFLSKVPKLSMEELALLRTLPAWQGRLQTAHTLLREMVWPNNLYKWDASRFAHLKVRTLLLLGGNSSAIFKNAIYAVHQALSNSTVTVMPGQMHVAMNTVPEQYKKWVLDFLMAPEMSKA
ncbi:MAG TPA: alpha/beta hydrolase [Anaerolineae bacterium]|jgi:pimeloyl-ACP methyl ester carboxylesterase